MKVNENDILPNKNINKDKLFFKKNWAASVQLKNTLEWNEKFGREVHNIIEWVEERISKRKIGQFKLYSLKNRKNEENEEWRMKNEEKWTELQRPVKHHYFPTIPKGKELFLWDWCEDPVTLTVSKVLGQPTIAQEMPFPVTCHVADNYLVYIPIVKWR